MTTAADVIAQARKHLGDELPQNSCARFVCQVFAEAGAPLPHPSAWVPTLVAQWPADDRDTDPSSAEPGDLVIFGDSEHVMISTGNGMVIGTGGGPGGQTVAEVHASSIYTGNHPYSPGHSTVSLILHAILSQPEATMKPVNFDPADSVGTLTLTNPDPNYRKAYRLDTGDLAGPYPIGTAFRVIQQVHANGVDAWLIAPPDLRVGDRDIPCAIGKDAGPYVATVTGALASVHFAGSLVVPITGTANADGSVIFDPRS